MLQASEQNNFQNRTLGNLEKQTKTIIDKAHGFSWTFAEYYTSESSFQKEFVDMQNEFENPINQDFIVYQYGIVEIYTAFWIDTDIKITHRLNIKRNCDEGVSFFHLMYTLNNAVVEYDTGDHRFYEGFTVSTVNYCKLSLNLSLGS